MRYETRTARLLSQISHLIKTELLQHLLRFIVSQGSSLSPILAGRRRLTYLELCKPSVEIRFSIIRLDADGSGEIIEGALIITQHAFGVAAIVVGHIMRWI